MNILNISDTHHTHLPNKPRESNSFQFLFSGNSFDSVSISAIGEYFARLNLNVRNLNAQNKYVMKIL